MPTHDLNVTAVRAVNEALHRLSPDTNETFWQIENPQGKHAIGVGIDAPVEVEINGHVGYYCGGMNKQAKLRIRGNAGTGVAENMMSGLVHVMGDATARCGISMKGIDILVKGSIGAMSAFMAQAGSLVVLGDAGDALGDSIYEATIFVRGEVKSLGTDCIEKPMTPDDRDRLADVLRRGGLNGEARVDDFRMYGSARRLYHFHIDNIASY